MNWNKAQILADIVLGFSGEWSVSVWWCCGGSRRQQVWHDIVQVWINQSQLTPGHTTGRSAAGVEVAAVAAVLATAYLDRPSSDHLLRCHTHTLTTFTQGYYTLSTINNWDLRSAEIILSRSAETWELRWPTPCGWQKTDRSGDKS